MKLYLHRTLLRPDYTVGKLYVDGAFFCDTLEDKDRNLYSGDKNLTKERKVMYRTAIPYGRYRIDMHTVSPKFSRKKQYKSIGGRLPRLLDVPLFEGVLIHIGNSAKDTAGCILVGKCLDPGYLVNSTETFFRLYEILQNAARQNERITVTVSPNPMP